MNLREMAESFLADNGLPQSEVSVVGIGPFIDEPRWEWSEFLIDADTINNLPQVSGELRIWYLGGAIVIRWSKSATAFVFEVKPGATKPPASELMV